MRGWFWGGLALLLGCGSNKAADATWYGKVGPLVEQHCAVCHQEGNIAPFPLRTYEQAKPMLSVMKAAIDQRKMPPFPPDLADGCPQYDDTRIMSDADRQTVLDWIAAGGPEGTPRTLDAPATPKPLGDPTDRWSMPEPYTSQATGPDDYRCFLIKPSLALPYLPVQAVSVEPGNRALVHHAAVYLIPPEQISAVQSLDDGEPGPGYSCFGGVGVSPAYPAGLWVPGNDQPLVPPYPGIGFYLPAGWAWVLQVHYNLATTRGSDQSNVVLWRAPWVTQTPHALVVGSTSFDIPAGSTSTVDVATGDFIASGQTPTATQTTQGQIYSVWAHEHLLGKTFQMDLVHPDGTRQCLLHIGSWSFHWQSIYRLHDFVVANPGDQLQVRCEWANPGSQDVHFGEGTSDEMCFGSVGLINP